jgi:hypothetical protein
LEDEISAMFIENNSKRTVGGFHFGGKKTSNETIANETKLNKL